MAKNAEFYSRMKEVKGYFLVYSQGRWGIIPKRMWTKEERNELQAIMREKIGKRRALAGPGQ